MYSLRPASARCIAWLRWVKTVVWFVRYVIKTSTVVASRKMIVDIKTTVTIAKPASSRIRAVMTPRPLSSCCIATSPHSQPSGS